MVGEGIVSRLFQEEIQDGCGKLSVYGNVGTCWWSDALYDTNQLGRDAVIWQPLHLNSASLSILPLYKSIVRPHLN